MQRSVAEFGAVADGETHSTVAIQATIDAVAAAGGGTVLLPAGRYVSGSLWMRPNVTLHLEAGTTLLGSARPEDFPLWSSQWEGNGVKQGRAALIGGEGADNIAITGRGTIDGRGQPWWTSQLANPGELRRPLLLRVVNCRNVLIEGVTFTNSPMWTVSPLACDNVVIRGITIRNPADSPNTDGINPDSCSNVRISDCHVDVGDDCITLKSGKETDGRRELRPCENITINNCTLVRGHGGVVIGSEISGGVRNVAISNCVFVGTDRGIRLKARRGRGGAIEDLRVSNLVMDNVGAALTVNLFYGCGAWNDPRVLDRAAHPVDAGTPRFRRLRFSNITATRVRWAGIYVIGLPEMPVEDIAFDNVSLFIDPDTTDANSPVMAPGVGKHCRAGIVAQGVRRLVLRDVDVHDQAGQPVRLTDCDDAVVR